MILPVRPAFPWMSERILDKEKNRNRRIPATARFLGTFISENRFNCGTIYKNRNVGKIPAKEHEWRMRRVGWAGPVLAAAFPLLLFFWLRSADSPDYVLRAPAGHFYIVSAVALLSTGIAVAVGIAGSRLRDIKVTVLSLAFVSLAEVFAVHGLATPHLLVHTTRLAGISSPLSVLFASFWLWLSTLPSDHKIMQWFARMGNRLVIGWTVVLGVLGIASMLFSDAIERIPFAQTPLDALVASLGLKVGDAWSEALAKRVAQAATYDKALRAAMRRLDRRAMSTRQLADKLRTLGFEPSIIEQVTARLTELGALNDRAYGEALIREIQRGKPAGPRLLRAKLAQKGLDRALIDELLAEAAADDDPVACARSLAQRRLTALSRYDVPTRRRRLWGLLARRGFDSDVIEQALTDLFEDDAFSD